MRQPQLHWPEYAYEALGLAVFMVSAAGFATLLQHPASPLAASMAAPIVRRVPMGIAMGLTSIALVYSPFGRRSGAHLNPAVTLTFFRLRKVAGVDAIGYIAAQFLGATAGIAVARVIFLGLTAGPPVNDVATMPGVAGLAAAFAGEALIAFGLMSAVLRVSNTPSMARFTGVAAGALVALYVVIEEPLSGMSMNPARTFGPAVLTRSLDTLWIYFTAPPLGMLAAAELYVRTRGIGRVRCAKLHHPLDVRCIFRCGYGAHAPEEVTVS